MGTLADSLFTALMSWVRALVSGLWALFSSEHTTVLEFLGKHWLVIALVIIAAGLVIDWMIWLLRWQPYHLWAQRARRLLRMDEPEDEEEEAPQGKAHAAVTQGMRYAPAEPEDEWENDFPPPALELDEQDAQQALANAERAPDEYAYPGMRYDSPAAENEELSGTRRYAAVRSEGPGAAEVERRRAEIDAWQLQMQEEARMRAEAERAAREREAYEAEQARLAQEAREAEQARLAQEAREAEQARLAQEEYERQLAQYEREKAQYELELARYEQEKAAYDAYMAQQAAEQQAAEQQAATQQSAAQQHETAPAAAAPRRRAAGRTYSDYVQGETVGELPDPPAWPQMNAASQTPKEKSAQGGLFGRMARMIEPEDEELISRTQLPPRVDPHEAYRPAKTPKKKG